MPTQTSKARKATRVRRGDPGHAAGTASDWNPVGGIAVPRSSSEDVALSMAIFQNEDDLLKGAFRSYPFLKKSEEKFEYGYR